MMYRGSFQTYLRSLTIDSVKNWVLCVKICVWICICIHSILQTSSMQKELYCFTTLPFFSNFEQFSSYIWLDLTELQQTYISVFQLFIFSPVKHHRMKEWLRLTQTSGDCLNQLICSNQVQFDQVAQSCVQLGCFCRWRLHNTSQQPGTVFDHLHTKKVFSYV